MITPNFHRPLPSKILVFPNCRYGFGRSLSLDRPMKVTRSFEYSGIAHVYLTSIGAIGFDFIQEGELASFDILESRTAGVVPDEVMENNKAIVGLQQRRQTFMNFIAAALFGRILAKQHCALEGASYCTLDKIFLFRIEDEEMRIEPHAQLIRTISSQLNAYQAASNSFGIDERYLDDAIDFVGELSRRESVYEQADIRLCMEMGYQASILHANQHAAASLALNVSVLETLVGELFLLYGLVGSREPKEFCRKLHSIQKISNGQFKDSTLNNRLKILVDGGLIDVYLYDRAEQARSLRNELMHKGKTVTAEASGACQTVLRDFWALLVEPPFELITGWSYRL